MKRLVSLLMAGMVLFSTAACGGSPASSAASGSAAASSGSAAVSGSADELDAVGDVEVEQELFDVVVTLPADLVGETTQEEVSQNAKDHGMHSGTLNEDGSVTYVMSKSQHSQYMKELRESLLESLAELPGSDGLENVTAVEANADFTSFTVTTTSTELTLTEGMSSLALYMYGALYNLFNGTQVDNIHIDFVNADSGEIIQTADSADMESEG